MTNRIGALPIIGSVMGVIRAVVSIIFILIATVMCIWDWIMKGDCDASLDVLKISAIEFGLGVSEILPGIGTAVHIYLDRELAPEYLRF